MPISPDSGCNPLDVYVHLASSRGAVLPIHALRERFGKSIDELIAVGAAQPGRPMGRVHCTACLESHAAEVAYEGATRRSWIFCPDAGRVWLDNAELATLQLTTSWLPDQLARALNIAPRPPPLTLIENAAWLLGDTVVGNTKVSIAVAIGIRGAGEFDQLIAGLGRRKVLDLGLLLVAGCQLPDYVGGPSRYTTVALEELAVLDGVSVRVEPARLDAWIRGLLRGSARSINARDGRPSTQAQVLAVLPTGAVEASRIPASSRKRERFAASGHANFVINHHPDNPRCASIYPIPEHESASGQSISTCAEGDVEFRLHYSI